MLGRLAALVRWREWFDSKLPMFLVAMLYAALQIRHPGTMQLGQIGALFVVLCLYAAFGHLINDYADRASDLAAGKERLLATWSELACFSALAGPCLGAAAIATVSLDGSTAELTIAAFVLAALYSLPPVRLKERGMLGWAAAAVAQRTLPVAIVFEAFHTWDRAAIGYTVLSTIVGFRFIIVHQLRDAASDRLSGVETAATAQGPHRLITILYIVFVFELVCLCGVVMAMAQTAPLLAAAAIAYAVYLIFNRVRGHAINPVSYFVLSGFYYRIWPIGLSILLAARNPIFLIVVVLAVALVQHQIIPSIQRKTDERPRMQF